MMVIGFIAEMENIAPNRMKERYGIQYANTFLKRTLGLMFKKDFLGTMIFTFKKSVSLITHTCFMHFPVDIIWYNEKNELIREVKNMVPWRIVFVNDVKRIIEKKSA